jgi:transketolase
VDTRTLAKQIRIHVLKMTQRAGSSHVGSVFSMADLVAVLYGDVLRVDPKKPLAPDRDRFILSKGHAGAGVYAALAERGFFPIEKLESYYQNGSDLSGHVSHIGIPGVELSTGSLGHGLSVGAGMAYSGNLREKKFRVITLLSDGECDEGSNWEAIMFAGHHRLDNLTAIIDYNKIQSLASVKEKWKSFGWGVREINGHNHDEILSVCRDLPFKKGRPNCIIAHTIKGKGVSFMENTVLWHYRSPQDEEYEAALKELSK